MWNCHLLGSRLLLTLQPWALKSKLTLLTQVPSTTADAPEATVQPGHRNEHRHHSSRQAMALSVPTAAAVLFYSCETLTTITAQGAPDCHPNRCGGGLGQNSAASSQFPAADHRGDHYKDLSRGRFAFFCEPLRATRMAAESTLQPTPRRMLLTSFIMEKVS